ncbi:MAG: hypothetical protein QF460_03370 [Candidatus Nanoarchaeia archaeon]|jgi:hypothetical protein|nr:hypothetical protein [Candidatus Nanoarchaeia archaeon]|tara:strand:- start:809 stop:1258 length:450 start_codon:yes stop_codon:yes gene_type:complete
MGYRGVIELYYENESFVSEEEKSNTLLANYIIKELKLLKRDEIFTKFEDSEIDSNLPGPSLNVEIELSKTDCEYLLDKLTKRTVSEIREVLNQEVPAEHPREKVILFGGLSKYLDRAYPTIDGLVKFLQARIGKMNDSDKKVILKIMCS